MRYTRLSFTLAEAIWTQTTEPILGGWSITADIDDSAILTRVRVSYKGYRLCRVCGQHTITGDYVLRLDIAEPVDRRQQTGTMRRLKWLIHATPCYRTAHHKARLIAEDQRCRRQNRRTPDPPSIRLS